MISCSLAGGSAIFVADTGSEMSIVMLEALAPHVCIDTHDSLIITGVTSDHMIIVGSCWININDKIFKFHVIDTDLSVEGFGLLGSDYFEKDQAEISYYHHTIVTASQPLRPIPFLNSESIKRGQAAATTSARIPNVLPIQARTRQVIPIKTTNPELTEGYLPSFDTGDDLFIGNAAVTVQNGTCQVFAIKTSSEDIYVQIAPQEIIPYDLLDPVEKRVLNDVSIPRLPRNERL